MSLNGQTLRRQRGDLSTTFDLCHACETCGFGLRRMRGCPVNPDSASRRIYLITSSRIYFADIKTMLACSRTRTSSHSHHLVFPHIAFIFIFSFPCFDLTSIPSFIPSLVNHTVRSKDVARNAYFVPPTFQGPLSRRLVSSTLYLKDPILDAALPLSIMEAESRLELDEVHLRGDGEVEHRGTKCVSRRLWLLQHLSR